MPGEEDATGVRRGPNLVSGHPPADDELGRPCPSSRHLSTAERIVSYNCLPEGDDRLAVCCVAARSTIKRRTCVLPTVTGTNPRTVTTITVSARRVPCSKPLCLLCQNPRALLPRRVPSTKSRPSSRVGLALSSSAKSSTDPAGLVGRKARRPCRAIFLTHGMGLQIITLGA